MDACMLWGHKTCCVPSGELCTCDPSPLGPVYTLSRLQSQLNLAQNRLTGELPADYPMPPGMLEFELQENDLLGGSPRLTQRKPTVF